MQILNALQEKSDKTYRGVLCLLLDRFNTTGFRHIWAGYKRMELIDGTYILRNKK